MVGKGFVRVVVLKLFILVLVRAASFTPCGNLTYCFLCSLSSFGVGGTAPGRPGGHHILAERAVHFYSLGPHVLVCMGEFHS